VNSQGAERRRANRVVSEPLSQSRTVNPASGQQGQGKAHQEKVLDRETNEIHQRQDRSQEFQESGLITQGQPQAKSKQHRQPSGQPAWRHQGRPEPKRQHPDAWEEGGDPGLVALKYQTAVQPQDMEGRHQQIAESPG
jgi:hypothetical protein